MVQKLDRVLRRSASGYREFGRLAPLHYPLFARLVQKLDPACVDYVTALIDVKKAHNRDVDLKCGRPTEHGLAVIVIPDSDAKQLTAQAT